MIYNAGFLALSSLFNNALNATHWIGKKGGKSLTGREYKETGNRVTVDYWRTLLTLLTLRAVVKWGLVYRLVSSCNSGMDSELHGDWLNQAVRKLPQVEMTRTAVLEKLDKSTTMIKIVFAVQEARRQHQCEYYKSFNLVPSTDREWCNCLIVWLHSLLIIVQKMFWTSIFHFFSIYLGFNLISWGDF
jgi:hypothetical protein